MELIRAPASKGRADPFSTPARRRRIVADVSSFLCKQYCLKACQNVVWHRKCTAAALLIQCAWRRKSAISKKNWLIYTRRNNAAIEIQKHIRMKLGILLLKKLRAAYILKCNIYLALKFQKAWRDRIARRRAAKKRALTLERLRRRKNLAAIQIQRCYRGLLGRRHVFMLLKQKSALFRLQLRSAIIIQCCVRKFAAIKRAKSMRNSRIIIARSILLWWKKVLLRRAKSVLTMQRYLRGFLAKMHAFRLRVERDKRIRDEFEKAERIRLEALFQKMFLEAQKKAEEDAKIDLSLKVGISLNILKHMAALGPDEVMKWCLDHSLLQFHEVYGYLLGALLFQIVDSVESTFSSSTTEGSMNSYTAIVKANMDCFPSSTNKDFSLPFSHDEENQIEAVEEDKKRITVAKWNLNVSNSIPATEYSPSKWEHVVGMKNGSKIAVYRNKRSINVTFQIRSQLSLSKEVELSITSPVTNTNKVKVEIFPMTTISILLESQCTDDSGMPSLITPSSDIMKTVKGLGENSFDQSDIIFRFRSVIICIDIFEMSEVLSYGGEPSNNFDDFDDSTESLFEEPLMSPKDEVVEDVIKSIDLNPFACVIQFAYRRRLQKRIIATLMIQKWVKSIFLNLRWKILVSEVLKKANFAAVFLQKSFRTLLAISAAYKMREILCRRLSSSCDQSSAYFVDDFSNIRSFLKDESENWKAFGSSSITNENWGKEQLDSGNREEDKETLEGIRSNSGCKFIVQLSPDLKNIAKSEKDIDFRGIMVPEFPDDCCHPLSRFAADADLQFRGDKHILDVRFQEDITIDLPTKTEALESERDDQNQKKANINMNKVPFVYTRMANKQIM